MKYHASSVETERTALGPTIRPEAVGPPIGLLSAAAAVVAIAWGLVPFGSPVARLGGWALGSLLTITLVSLYTASDARRSQSSLYAAKPGMAHLRSLVVLAGIMAAAVHAFAFATKVAS
jgi:hypothetical protein